MKILSVRFANLNSLAGEWCIDFTHPAYTANGIFAITGATGAGKSTVLDAISLALYGRTPRLKQITKSTNEIMSRQTGECFAEIEFTTSKGQYRCHWSQHRARKHARGELQPPRHECVDGTNNQVLESKLKNVNQKVTEVTGMNFDQFTRSMLLAQGDFSKFLQASSDERAPLLEQITGTEIYSLISKQVHKKMTEEKEKLNQLQREIDGAKFMTDDDEHADRQSLHILNLKAKTLQQDIAENTVKSAWCHTIKTLAATVTELQREKEQIDARWLATEHDRIKVKEAESCHSLHGRFSHLERLQTVQSGEENQLKTTLQGTIAEEKRLVSAKNIIAQSEALYQKKSAEKIDTDHIIKEVNRFDTMGHQTDNERAEIETAMKVDEQEIASLGEEQQKITTLISAQNMAIENVQGYLKEHEIDGHLLVNIAGIKEKIHSLAHLIVETTTLKNTLLQAEQKQLKTKTELVLTRERVSESEELYHKQLQQLRDIEKELTQKTTGNISTLYAKFQATKDTRAFLLTTTKLTQELADIDKDLSHLQSVKTDFHTQNELLKKELSQIEREHELRKQTVSKQEEILFLASRVENYAKERDTLRAEEPCPLCGSLQHPYVHSRKISPVDARETLTTERALLAQIESQNRKLQSTFDLTSLEIRKIQETLYEKENQQKKLSTERALLFEKLHLVPPETELSQLSEQIRKLTRELEKIEGIITRVEWLYKEQKDQTNHLKKMTKKVEEQKNLLTESQHRLQTRQDTLNHTKSELQEKEALLTKNIHRLNVTIAPYAVGLLTTKNYSAIHQQLKKKRNDWKSKEKKAEELQSATTKLQGEKAQQELKHSHLSNARELKQKKIGQLFAKAKELNQKRFILFANNDPDEVESRLTGELTEIEHSLRQQRVTLGESEKLFSALVERSQTLTISTREREEELQQGKQLFQEKLTKQGFGSTSEFKQAILPDDRYQILKSSLTKLDDQQTKNLTLLDSIRQNLQKEQGKKLTTRSMEKLTTEVAEQNDTLKNVQQETGAINNRLSRQTRLIAEQEGKRKLYLSQQTEYGHWSQLHALIGAADGKKFRNFAQGLTFERMIYHANKTLNKMSDRYLLVRDLSRPLELNIIDNYQAGEIRSTANLSGGETFIVSLALALGLAGMASKNIQIDSLFLDEGFGTLDEESLEVALVTLTTLQQEGKIIGIISHVPLLKDRIDVQIRISPGLGGKSVMSGPGVSFNK